MVQVFDLKLILFIRFICGYHISITSSKFRFLSKIYRLWLVALIIYLGATLEMSRIYFHFSYITEYWIYFLISWYTKDEYILRFYQPIPIIDTLHCATEIYKKFLKLIHSIFFMTISLRLVNYGVLSLDEDHMSTQYVDVYFFNTSCLIRDVGLFSIVMIFAVIYLRLIAIRRTIEMKGVYNIQFQKCSARQYIEMYEVLVDAVTDVGLPLKFMILTSMIISVPRAIFEYFVAVSVFKTYGLKLDLVLTLTFSLFLSFASLVGGMIIWDLINDELIAIKALINEKMIYCMNELVRYELQLFLDVMNHRPLQFNLWHLLPFNYKVLVTFSSFCVINTMAVVQVASYNLNE